MSVFWIDNGIGRRLVNWLKERFELEFKVGGNVEIRSYSVVSGDDSAKCIIEQQTTKENENLTEVQIRCFKKDARDQVALIQLGHGTGDRAGLYQKIEGFTLQVNIPVSLDKKFLLRQQSVDRTIHNSCQVEVISNLVAANNAGFNSISFLSYLGNKEVNSKNPIITAGKYNARYEVLKKEQITPATKSKSLKKTPEGQFVVSHTVHSSDISVMIDGPNVDPFIAPIRDVTLCAKQGASLLYDIVEDASLSDEHRERYTVSSVRVGGDTCPLFVEFTNNSKSEKRVQFKPAGSQNKSYMLGMSSVSDIGFDGPVVNSGETKLLYFNPSNAWVGQAPKDEDDLKDYEWMINRLLQGHTYLLVSGEKAVVRRIGNKKIEACLIDGDPLFLKVKQDLNRRSLIMQPNL